MPRSRLITKRRIIKDPVYQSETLTRFINRVMRDGKKGPARKQVYSAMELLREKTKKEPLSVFNSALDNIKPLMEVRPRRVGGAVYQIPAPVRPERKESLALHWLIQAAHARPSREFHTFAEKLVAEIMDAFNKTGGAIKKKEDMHRMAEANKAFAHFRW